jgi:transcription elongation factor
VRTVFVSLATKDAMEFIIAKIDLTKLDALVALGQEFPISKQFVRRMSLNVGTVLA